MKTIFSVRNSLSKGRPYLLTLARSVGRLQIEFRMRVSKPGMEQCEEKPGIAGHVERLVMLRIRRHSRSKSAPSDDKSLRRSVRNPFVDNLSRMEGNGPKVGPALANLASIGRIL